jgi:hypothetical protein
MLSKVTDCVRNCGKSRPMASNDSAEGRRVKLVVSGEVMCTKIVTLSLARIIRES